MVNRESSKQFENDPFCASTMLLFSLFNKDVYFILKLVQSTTMRLYDKGLFFKRFDISRTRSTSKQSANGDLQ